MKERCGKAVVVGGGRGIGLAVVKRLLAYSGYDIYVLGLHNPDDKEIIESPRVQFFRVNLIQDDIFPLLDEFGKIDFLFISAGFGRVAPFSDLTDAEIVNSVKVNELAVFRIIRYYYQDILKQQYFYCGVMGSIAGLISSPMFSVYGATKAAICKFIESVNIELAESGSPNRILNISPGRLEGTGFYGKNQDLSRVEELTENIIKQIYERATILIPKFDTVYKRVLEEYHRNPALFGRESYHYKKNGGRIDSNPQVTVGYLSGTFDLFHVGHLNLLRRAKAYCDYLVVGVHRSGAWKGKETLIPFEERMEIVKSITYVDRVIPSYLEDCDAYDSIRYDYLFVGNDYKGSERFERYEAYFADKGVKIIYFPYTKEISSTKLRWEIKQNGND